MRKITTILAPIISICTLTISIVLFIQYNTLTRGHNTKLPHQDMDIRPDNLFGINVKLQDYSDEQINEILRDINELGFGWIRQSFELTPSGFNWQISDHIIRTAYENNINVIAVLTDTQLADQNPQFIQFVNNFTARYSSIVDVYQIGDEPNLQSSWGRNPSAIEYTNLQTNVYPIIHQLDSDAVVLTAGLAPNTETGPENISDIHYLRQLYDAGASDYFDAVAGKPYGFNFSPNDRRYNHNILNFSRHVLLREEMEKANDTHSLLWATQFGWYNSSESKSPLNHTWGQVTENEQSTYTIEAFKRARNEWPWSGVMVLENYSPSTNLNDPRWGFAITTQNGNQKPIASDIKHYLSSIQLLGAPHGIHAPNSIFAKFGKNWKFSDLGADIPQFGNTSLNFTFEGTDVGIIVRRGDYRATLYVEIDSKPANMLPLTANGESYQILTSPDLANRVEIIHVATNLEMGKHVVSIRAERGWNQWAIVGFSIGNKPDISTVIIALVTSVLLFVISLTYIALNNVLIRKYINQSISYLNNRAHLLTTICFGLLFWMSAGITWGQKLPQLFYKQNELIPIAITTISALTYYASPWLIISLTSLLTLLILFMIRPSIALAMIALVIPFYLYPKAMFERVFSTTEVFTLLALASTIARQILFANKKSTEISYFRFKLSNLDKGVLIFGIISSASIFGASEVKVALTELRVIIIEPILFYILIRITPLNKKELIRISDYFIVGALLVAVIGVYQYILGVNLIATDDGILRMRSVFGSPNNVGLFLGRALPISMAMAIVPSSYFSRMRRTFYAFAFLLMLTAILLSFSRGAILLGVPFAVISVAIYFYGKKSYVPIFIISILGLILVYIFSPQLRMNTINNQTFGPTFFRINLWKSTISMIADNLWTGVGLDNFLYAYRGKYILPVAWQDPNMSHAHNFVLDFLSRLGIFGLASIIWIIYTFFKHVSIKIKTTNDPIYRAITIGFASSMINFMTHGLVDASYWFVDLAYTFMMTLAIIQCIENTDISVNDKSN